MDVSSFMCMCFGVNACLRDVIVKFEIFEYKWGSPSGVVANVLECDIVVSEFELRSRYYVHFRTFTLGKGINPLYPPLLWVT